MNSSVFSKNDFDKVQDALLILVLRQDSERRMKILEAFVSALEKKKSIGSRLSVWKKYVENVIVGENLYRGMVSICRGTVGHICDVCLDLVRKKLNFITKALFERIENQGKNRNYDRVTLEEQLGELLIKEDIDFLKSISLLQKHENEMNGFTSLRKTNFINVHNANLRKMLLMIFPNLPCMCKL